MTRYFTVDEARDMLPEATARIEKVAAWQRELVELIQGDADAAVETGAIAAAKGLEAHIHEELEWFDQEGIQVKGVAPALLDFPALADGVEVLLCWLQGEHDIDWYHSPALGFAGREPLDQLALQ